MAQENNTEVLGLGICQLAFCSNFEPIFVG